MEAEMLRAMHEFSCWLCLNIRILVKYSNLLNVDERSNRKDSIFEHPSLHFQECVLTFVLGMYVFQFFVM